MNFVDFVGKIEFLDKKRRSEYREKYIENFINSNDKSYREQIQLRHRFVDGYCYLGYLWDYIISPVVIEEEEIKEIAKKMGGIYVFWDIHTCERIFIKDYWKFDKDAILKMNVETLLQGEEYLPEDIYIFDESFSWTLIKTHEDINGNRFCLKSGNI